MEEAGERGRIEPPAGISRHDTQPTGGLIMQRRSESILPSFVED
jgi:hypothetical protein